LSFKLLKNLNENKLKNQNKFQNFQRTSGLVATMYVGESKTFGGYYLGTCMGMVST
jgi:hypothetical protein